MSPYIDADVTIPDLLERRIAEAGDEPFLYFEDNDAFTIRQLNDAANRVVAGLRRHGVAAGDRVAVMLPNHPDYVSTMLALLKMRAVWVPINIHLQGQSLSYILEHSEPHALIADVRYRDVLEPALTRRRPPLMFWRDDETGQSGDDGLGFYNLLTHEQSSEPCPESSASDVVCISYTSGTTGEPKGVLVTDKMLRASATGAIIGGDINDDDVLLVWEPLYHIAGIETVIAGLVKKIQIALLERFSASQFWDQVDRYGATHIHYVGGVLQILLKKPPRPSDSQNTVRITWGGGCTGEVWRQFEERFGVQIREVYGLTEAASISTINTEGQIGSIGKAAPYFDVKLADDEGRPVVHDTLGEIVIAEREPGLLMSGYFRKPEETAKTLRDGWLLTGDLARMDEDGFLYYAGRKKDSIRHRGENISAWEVERVINEHPEVELSALIGVPSDLGESELKIFLKPVAGCKPDPAALIKWCESRLPYFQVPRYIAYIDDFDVTPTHRILKDSLSRFMDDCWDRQNPQSVRDH